MALPKLTSLKSRNLSRRDHVLNLLPPLTVVNKEDVTMHDRLFADNPPPKNYPENFPGKVLRHLGAWTFYSAPTKGELALLDKSMYNFKNETEKTDTTEKKHSTHTEYKTEEGTQSHLAGDSKKRLETTKGKTLKANKVKEVQHQAEYEKTSQKETNEKIKQEKSCVTSRKSNASPKIKRQVSEDKNNNVQATNKPIKRGLNSNRQQKNTKVNKQPTKSKTVIAEITFKKSRGKVLGGAETGAEIGTATLTVEGHNVSVQGPKSVHGKRYKNITEATQDAETAIRTGDHREKKNFNTTEQKGNKLRKGSCDMYTPVTFDGHKESEETVTLAEKTQTKNVKRTVIKIPLQENESPEETDNNKTITPLTEDLNSQNNADSHKSEKCVNEKNDGICRENPCSNTENEILHEKHVTFSASCGKEPARGKKRPKPQTGRKKEHKRSNKNRVKSG